MDVLNNKKAKVIAGTLLKILIACAHLSRTRGRSIYPQMYEYSIVSFMECFTKKYNVQKQPSVVGCSSCKRQQQPTSWKLNGNI